MKYIIEVLLFVISCSVAVAQPKVIAHRGYWNCEGSSQNSIASLQNAARIGAYGSEFDVHVTADGYIIIYHDDKLSCKRISKHLSGQFNPEKYNALPTLYEYLEEARHYPDLKLILEIKSGHSPEAETRAVEIILENVINSGLYEQVEYIAFSLHVVKEVLRLYPAAQVSYLEGDLAPAEIARIGATGIDYNIKTLKKNPHWITEAKDYGLTVNSWTVNKEKDMRWLIEMGVDYITTDEPELLQRILSENLE